MIKAFRECPQRRILETFLIFENNNFSIHCGPSINSDMGQSLQFLWRLKAITIEDDLIEIVATYLPQPALQAPFSASIEPNCKIDCFFIHQSISLLRPT